MMKSIEAIRHDSAPRTVTCRRCAGKGRHEMGPELARTIAAIGYPEWQSTDAIRTRIGKGETAQCVTALNNRLVELRREGLVESRRSGRALEWRLR